MKKKLLLLSSSLVILLVFANVCFGQKDFEGHITYNAFGETKDSSRKFMDVFFKKDMLKINFIKDSLDPNEFSQYIYDFKKGISYEINPEEKLIVSHSLKKDALYTIFTYDLLPDLPKNILGHNCAKYHIINPLFGHSGIISIKAWFPNDIKFYVPGALHYINPRMFFNGRTFSFEVEIIKKAEELEEGDKIEDTISIRTVLIENKSIGDSVFRLNKGFTIKTLHQYQKETMGRFTPPRIVPGEPTNQAKKATPKSTKKKAPIKAAGTRPKE